MKNLIKLADAKVFAECSEDVLEKLKSLFSEDDIEGLNFEHDGIWYELADIGRDKEIDEGKYINGCVYYQLCSFDKTKAKYLCDASKIETFDVVVEQSYSKCGSYFSDYEWYYDEPSVAKITIKVVPEVVIPEHEEVSFEYK